MLMLSLSKLFLLGAQLAKNILATRQPILQLRLQMIDVHAIQALEFSGNLVSPLCFKLQSKLLFLVVAAFQRVGIAGERRLLAALDLDDLHLEDQNVATLDLRGRARVTVSKLAGDVHLPLVAFNLSWY